ncbi:MAG: alpha/beta hydrolase [bacterium]
MKRRIKRLGKLFGIFSILIFIAFLILNIVFQSYLNSTETKTVNDLIATNGHFIQTSHGNIYYIKSDYTGIIENKKNSILLIHGFGANTISWENNMSACALISDCYAIDLKGYGLSKDITNTNLSNESQADMVIEVADKLGIKEFSIIGNSMGGAISQIVALKAQERVGALILVSSANPNNNYAGISFPLMRLFVDPFYMLLSNPKNMTDFLTSAYSDPKLILDKTLKGYMDPYSIKGRFKTFRYIVSSRQDGKYNSEDINIPVLIVHGENDHIIPLENSKELSKKIPLSMLEIIPNSGHVSMEETPDKFNALMTDFLGKLK